MNNCNIVSDRNNENNPALKNFNQAETLSNKKTERRNQKSSQKFPMPRKYQPNMCPDREMSSIELTKEMVDYYDNKNKPKEYQDFINKTLDYKNKKKKQKKAKQKEGKQEFTATTKINEHTFGDVENFHFVLCNNAPCIG